jgi:arylsulfatase
MSKGGSHETPKERNSRNGIGRRDLLLSGTAIVAAAALGGTVAAQPTQELTPTAPPASESKPNILVIFGDDIGLTNVSAYSMGLMGYHTPNIDRIAKEGMIFTDYYAEQSCTAGRSTFITGQCTLRTGLSKVGVPGSPVGLQDRDITIAQALKPLGYATGQFGKNHLGDLNRYLPTVHGFDEFFATSITSTPRKSRSSSTTQLIRNSRSNLVRAAYCAAKPRRPTIRPSNLVGDASGSKPSRTPVR